MKLTSVRANDGRMYPLESALIEDLYEVYDQAAYDGRYPVPAAVLIKWADGARSTIPWHHISELRYE